MATAAERKAKERAARDAAGLKRMEVYAHPADHPPIKALAAKLTTKRARGVARAKKREGE